MKKETTSSVIKYWIQKAKEAIDSASIELKAGHLDFSVNRLYYACFYSASALLLNKDLKFKKHSGVRAAFHKHVIKEKLLSEKYGKLYDELYEARQSGDYIEFSTFERKDVENWIEETKDFVGKVAALLREHL